MKKSEESASPTPHVANQIVVYQPNETMRLDVRLDAHEIGGLKKRAQGTLA